MNDYLNRIFKSSNKLVKLGTFLCFYIMKSFLRLQHTQAEFLNERPNFGRSRSKSPGSQESSLFQVPLAMYNANSINNGLMSKHIPEIPPEIFSHVTLKTTEMSKSRIFLYFSL